MKIISPLFKGTVNTWLGKKILRSKPGIPISNNFYFKYSVNIYVDMQQNFWFCKPKSSFKRRKEEKKNQKVAHYQNLRTWSGDKIKIFM